MIINAPVHGDLVVAGGKIYINDTVNDVFLAGGVVVINGYVRGKIRCLGGRLRVDRAVQTDLVAAGGEIIIERNAVVLGNVLVSGGNFISYGNVQGNIRAATGKLQLFGMTGGDLNCRGATIELNGKVMGASELAASDGLIVGNSAVFNGPVRYWAPTVVDFGSSLRKGLAVRDESLAVKQTHWYFLGNAGWLSVLWYLASALLVIILLQYFFSQAFHRAGEKAYDNMPRSLGFGVLFFLGTPVAVVLSFLSLVALPIGVGLLLGYVFLLLISGSITAVVASHWFAGVMGSHARFWEHVWIGLGFFILLRLILSIPFFGWILFPLLACIAFGALLLSIRWNSKRSYPAVGAGPLNEGRGAILQKA